MKTLSFSLLISLLTLVGSALHAAPSISAELSPAEVPLGQSARLSIRVHDAPGGSHPAIPDVNDLQITSAGQSSQYRIVNGTASSTVDYSYRVTPQKVGDFEIPIISVIHKGQVLKTPALSLRALPSGAAPSKTNPAPEIADKDLAFLQLDREELGDRNHLYVGETTPIRIRAFIREGLRVNGLNKPSLTHPAYTLDNLSDRPQQERVVIDGVRYTALTWFGGLTGVKAGDYNFKAELNATLGIPQKSNRGNQRNRRGGFNDPFFDDFFNSAFTQYTPREVTMESEASEIEVRSLPQKGRPDNFSGAIGQFTLQASELPSALKTGDPVSFQVVVDGQGTFDRMSAPTLEPEALWKTYDPEETFKGNDIIGFRGTKTFTLPAIAREPGTHEVAFSLPYFDPKLGEYQTARTGTATLTITGEALAAEITPVDSATPAPENKSPLMTGMGRIVRNHIPLHQRTWFRATQGGLLGTMVLASLFLLVRGKEKDPQVAIERALRKAIDELQKKAATAVAQKDVAGFFHAARSILGLQAAHQWGGNPGAITHADILKHCPPDSKAAEIFATASDLEYSGLNIEPSTLPDWNRTLESALTELRNPSTPASESKPAHWGQVSQSA
ncbi:BatD family protein [Akkermansiaceae bacterium]|nr:BatD family protein [Akkermansiaceae bacterium]MDA7888365.1 BatD family protein [Akkermansiaceae bacterium]MDB4537379.1 BatD family protein [Akkermansiaceae bacterium]